MFRRNPLLESQSLTVLSKELIILPGNEKGRVLESSHISDEITVAFKDSVGQKLVLFKIVVIDLQIVGCDKDLLFVDTRTESPYVAFEIDLNPLDFGEVGVHYSEFAFIGSAEDLACFGLVS